MCFFNILEVWKDFGFSSRIFKDFFIDFIDLSEFTPVNDQLVTQYSICDTIMECRNILEETGHSFEDRARRLVDKGQQRFERGVKEAIYERSTPRPSTDEEASGSSFQKPGTEPSEECPRHGPRQQPHRKCTIRAHRTCIWWVCSDFFCVIFDLNKLTTLMTENLHRFISRGKSGSLL